MASSGAIVTLRARTHTTNFGDTMATSTSFETFADRTPRASSGALTHAWLAKPAVALTAGLAAAFGLQAAFDFFGYAARWVPLVSSGGGVAAAVALIHYGTASFRTTLAALTHASSEIAAGQPPASLPRASGDDSLGRIGRNLEAIVRRARETEAERNKREREAEQAAHAKRLKMLELAESFQGSVSALFNQLAVTAEQVKAAAHIVSEGSSQVTERSTAVANASGIASSNVQSVAAATEELSFSIREISDQVHRSYKIAAGAAAEAEKTNTQVRELADAATRIGSIVDMITEIASQTNMLALNATIEAARAGEAGRGFAVVAQEVKALAEQTAKATTEIGGQISGIQASSSNAATFIASIAKTTQDVSAIASSIASAVEEQGAATQEIARNIQEASKGTQEVATSVESVARISSNARKAAADILTASQDLATQADAFQVEMTEFLKSIRA